MAVTLTKTTATFHVSPARHGRHTRDLMAQFDGQTVTVVGRSRLLGQTEVSAGGRTWTVFDSELSDHS